jgi:type VI secretion system secreted protein Hcp
MPIAPFEIFLKLDGIEGESTVKGHEKETVVLSYDQSIHNPGGGGPGGGSGAAGKSTFSPVRFRKPIDRGSIPLLLACAAGTHIKDAQFTFRLVASAFEFYKVKLVDVVVASIGQVAGTGEQYPLTFGALAAGADNHGFLDEVTLDYAKIQWEYRTVGPSGKTAGPVTGGWDLTVNKKV